MDRQSCTVVQVTHTTRAYILSNKIQSYVSVPEEKSNFCGPLFWKYQVLFLYRDRDPWGLFWQQITVDKTSFQHVTRLRRMNLLGVLLLPLDGMPDLVLHRLTSSLFFTVGHSYT